jgi:hypothetical protein
LGRNRQGFWNDLDDLAAACRQQYFDVVVTGRTIRSGSKYVRFILPIAA